MYELFYYMNFILNKDIICIEKKKYNFKKIFIIFYIYLYLLNNNYYILYVYILYWFIR